MAQQSKAYGACGVAHSACSLRLLSHYQAPHAESEPFCQISEEEALTSDTHSQTNNSQLEGEVIQCSEVLFCSCRPSLCPSSLFGQFSETQGLLLKIVISHRPAVFPRTQHIGSSPRKLQQQHIINFHGRVQHLVLALLYVRDPLIKLGSLQFYSRARAFPVP